jgi:hypothetical protein
MEPADVLQFIVDDFTWTRPAKDKAGRRRGFQWEGEGEGLRLVPIKGVAFEPYQPDTALFRNFGALATTTKAIVGFADRYGATYGTPSGAQESFDAWCNRIATMKSLVQVADALDTGDAGQIRFALGGLTEADFAAIAERRNQPTGQLQAASITGDEYVHAALARIGYVLLTRKGMFEGLSLEGSRNTRTGRVEARFRHADLWSSMLFQFGLAMVGGRRFQQCAFCGRWFRLQPGVARADKTTCSPSHRYQLYLRRRRRAVEMHKGGMTARQIAKELGSELSKVKQWLKDKR